MEQEGIFKTVTFGGFDRKSVLSYIDALTEKFHLSEQEYQQQLEGYAKAQESQVGYIKKLETQLADLESRIETVTAQLKAEQESSARIQLKTLESQAAELQQKYRDADRELQAQQELARQLQFKVDALEFKGKKYDDISVELGDAMLLAKQNADRLVKEATQETDQLREDSTRQAEQQLADAKRQSEQMLEDAKQQSEQMLEDAKQQSEQMLEDAKQQSAQLGEESKSQAERLVGDAESHARETLEQATTRAAEITSESNRQMTQFFAELSLFKGDSSRLRKSVEEILFVLNDRVDVMQNVVSQVENRFTLELPPLPLDPPTLTAQPYAPKPFDLGDSIALDDSSFVPQQSLTPNSQPNIPKPFDLEESIPLDESPFTVQPQSATPELMNLLPFAFEPESVSLEFVSNETDPYDEV